MNYELMWNELRKRIGETRKLYFDLKNAGVQNEGLTGYHIMCDIESMLDTIELQEEIRDKLKNTFCLESKKDANYDIKKLFNIPWFKYADTDAIYFESEENDNVDDH